MRTEPLPVETAIVLLPEEDSGYIVGYTQLEDTSYRYSIATYGVQGYLDNIPRERLKLVGLPVVAE